MIEASGSCVVRSRRRGESRMSEEPSENPHLIDELDQYRRLLDNIPAEIGER